MIDPDSGATELLSCDGRGKNTKDPIGLASVVFLISITKCLTKTIVREEELTLDHGWKVSYVSYSCDNLLNRSNLGCVILSSWKQLYRQD